MTNNAISTGRVLLKFKLKLRGPNQSVQMSQKKPTFIGRRPQNTLGQYPSNHWSDLSQILNLGDGTKVCEGLR